MTEHLQKAIEGLEIQDVYQRKLNAYCSPDFDPKFNAVQEMMIQLMHVVRQSEMLEVDDGEGNGTVTLFRVVIALGVRWVLASEDGEAPSSDDEAEDLARIEGRMVAEYVVKHDIPEEGLIEFSMRNASYHVWPYWREIVASQCAKMNLPPVCLPMVQFAFNRQSGVREDGELSPPCPEEMTESKARTSKRPPAGSR